MGLFKNKVQSESIEVKKNWYADRYQTVVVQRNFLVLLLILALAGVILAVLSMVRIASSKTVEPFVIEVEERSGITNVIRPLSVERYSTDEAIQKFYLYNYVTKRESYNPLTYSYNYDTVIRLLSGREVYAAFKAQISTNNPDSPLRLGQGQRIVKGVSIGVPVTVKGQSGLVVNVRFRTEDSGGAVRNRVAVVNFMLTDMLLTMEERAVNPLGFQVIGYRVEDESLQ